MVLTASSIISDTVSSADDIANAVAATFRMEIDTKAMRKLHEEDSLYAAFEVTEVGVSTMTVQMDSRLLVKLP